MVPKFIYSLPKFISTIQKLNVEVDFRWTWEYHNFQIYCNLKWNHCLLKIIGNITCQKAGEQQGKWFIENLNLTSSTILYIMFFSNSFSYSDGVNRYYLFGNDYLEPTWVYTHALVIQDPIFTSQPTSTSLYATQGKRSETSLFLFKKEIN